jgi:hypothetical protein
MTQTLYILNYNNYYNRILKKYNTLQKYLDYSEELYVLQDTVFIPNDGVNTDHSFGDTMAPYDGRGNYLLVVENNEIISRWFIIDGKRDRMGQWTLTLHRDVLADYYEEVTNAPCFIEKGYISNIYDPAIFNNENMTFNQIKTEEYPLKDATGTSWIVGYINRSLNTDKPISLTPAPYFDFSADSLNDFEPYVKYRAGQDTCPEEFSYVKWLFTYSTTSSSGYSTQYHQLEFRENMWFDKYEALGGLGSYVSTSFSASKTIYDPSEGLASNLRAWYNTPDRENPFPSYVNTLDLVKCDGKILKVGTDDSTARYYKMTKGVSNVRLERRSVGDAGGANAAVALYNIFSQYGGVMGGELQGKRTGIYATVSYNEYYLNFQDITNQFRNTSFTISATRNRLQDAPYDIICTPLNSTILGGIPYNEAELGLLIGQTLYTELGGGGANANIFDVQLLPYCPLSGLDEFIDSGFSGLVENRDFDYVKEGDNIVSFVLYPKTSSFTGVIPFTFIDPTDPVEFKVNHECNLFRLCSPNYNGVFEFKTTTNGGLEYFEINATYKPYNPYIHLNPNFGRLYGGDFNDQRGLILGGDFSIAALSSAWEQYQLQNKNYQNIFDRQIQNMEFNNSIARVQEAWQVATGTLQGAASGATTGAMASMGNPYVAAAGAVVGATTSLAGGIADLYYNEQLRGEALDYTKDMFGYNLGNIKAMPQSLSKSSAFDINNKMFPFLEYYTATETEKDALRNKLKYNGMTVMRIGKIEPYTYSNNKYVKGKIIRLEDFQDDYHIANTISDEVNKGFFIVKEDTN